MTEKKPTISSLKREIERLKARAVVLESEVERVRDAMAKAMAKATELTPEKRAYSKKELSAIAAYTAIAGNPIGLRFEGVSMHDVIEAGVRILAAEVLSLNAADAGIKAVLEYRP